MPSTTTNDNKNNMGATASREQRPSSPLLSKALNETFDEAFGGTVQTPKANSSNSSSSPFASFFQKLQPNNSENGDDDGIIPSSSSSGSLASLTQFLNLPENMASQLQFLNRESTQKYVARMQHLSHVSQQFLEESLRAIHKSNERQLLLSGQNGSSKATTTIVMAVFPLLVLGLAQLSTCQSRLVDVLFLAAFFTSVWKWLLPLAWKEQKVALLQQHCSTVTVWYQHHSTTLSRSVETIRHQTLGCYTSTEIQSLQKDLQHLELHLQETKRQLVRCQHQHQADSEEQAELQEQQLQQAKQELNEKHRRAMDALKDDHAQSMQTVKERYEKSLHKQTAQLAELRQTLQGQETLLQDERRKVKTLKQSIEQLEQVAQQDASHVEELQRDLHQQQRDHAHEMRERQASYEHARTKAKQQRTTLQEESRVETERLQTALLHHQVQQQKLNRLLCQLLIVADDTNDYFFDNDLEDLASIQDKFKVLQEAIEEASKYVASLKQVTKRDESLCLPERSAVGIESDASSAMSELPSIVSELSMQEREAILEVLSKDHDFYNNFDTDASTLKLLRRTGMILLATAGLTTVATTSPQTLATLFGKKR